MIAGPNGDDAEVLRHRALELDAMHARFKDARNLASAKNTPADGQAYRQKMRNLADMMLISKPVYRRWTTTGRARRFFHRTTAPILKFPQTAAPECPDQKPRLLPLRCLKYSIDWQAAMILLYWRYGKPYHRC